MKRLFIHSDPSIADRHHHVLAGHYLGVGGGVALVQIDVRGLNRQQPAVRHRIARVDSEVQNRALELVLIDIHRPQPGRQDALEFDGFAQGPVKEVGHLADGQIEVGRLRGQRLTP